MCLNARSIINKMDRLMVVVANINPEIIRRAGLTTRLLTLNYR